MYKLVAGLLLLCGYFLAMHLTLIEPRYHSLAVLFAVVPLLFMGGAQLFGWFPKARLFLALGFILFSMYLFFTQQTWWPWLVAQTERVYLIQHVGTMLFFAGFFALSFRHPEGNWITRIAKVIHQGLSAKERAYTQKVGWAWVLLFLIIALFSLILYFAQAKTAWSALVNMLTWPIIALAFAVEYGIRRWHLHDSEHISLSDTVTRVRKAWREGL